MVPGESDSLAPDRSIDAPGALDGPAAGAAHGEIAPGSVFGFAAREGGGAIYNETVSNMVVVGTHFMFLLMGFVGNSDLTR